MRTETLFVPFLGDSNNSYANSGAGNWRYHSAKDKAAKAVGQSGAELLDPFDQPVQIGYFARLSKRRRNRDVDNYGMSAKQITDALRRAGLFVDDTQAYVVGVYLGPSRTAPDGVEGFDVVIREVKPEPGQVEQMQTAFDLGERRAF